MQVGVFSFAEASAASQEPVRHAASVTICCWRFATIRCTNTPYRPKCRACLPGDLRGKRSSAAQELSGCQRPKHQSRQCFTPFCGVVVLASVLKNVLIGTGIAF